MTLRVEESACQWLDLPAGSLLTVPINHNEGNYTCDAETLARLNANGQVVDCDAVYADLIKPAERKRIHTFLSTSPVHMKWKLQKEPHEV